MRRKLLFAVSVLLTSTVLVGAGWAVHMALKPKSAVPADIRKQLDFTPYTVKPESTLKADGKSYKYDASQKGFSFVASGGGTGRLTVSEQATPQSFIDIPDLYTKLVDNLNRYGAFNNQMGTVYLTRPKDQPRGQTAVINSNGVLMFVRSAGDLRDDQWRKLFQSFSLES